jgi:cofilin
MYRSPDGAKIKDKMVAASSREAIRRSLVGIAIEIQGTDNSEVAYETGAGFLFVLIQAY